MDISSRYLSRLKRPSLRWPAYFWQFLQAISWVGKGRELISFVCWEISHQCQAYRITDRYVQFTDTPYLSMTTEPDPLMKCSLADPFLAGQGLHFSPVAVDWKFCVATADGIIWGSCFSKPCLLYYSEDQSASAVLVYEFERPITSFFISQRNDLFVCSDGRIFKSSDRGRTFRVVLRLSTPISYFLFNNGMTELPDQTLLIGEYGSIWHGRAWQNLAYLYHSTDDGQTWQTADFLLRQGVNKHIHLVQYCALLNAIFLTDGDNKKQIWINNTLSAFNQQVVGWSAGWRLINRHHHQTGGYTSMAETENAVLFGSDYLGGTNFIIKTTDGKQFEKLVLPDPYRRSPVMNMVSRQRKSGTEIWAVSYSCLSGNTRSLLMYSPDSGRSWTRVIDFDGKYNEIRIVSSSHDLQATVYVSVTEFGKSHQPHRHVVYALAVDPFVLVNGGLPNTNCVTIEQE